MSRPTQRTLNPQPINGLGYNYLAIGEGKPLNNEHISSIGHTLYSRFYQTTESPDYKNIMADKIRNEMEKRVKEVVDSLILKGFKVIPPLA